MYKIRRPPGQNFFGSLSPSNILKISQISISIFLDKIFLKKRKSVFFFIIVCFEENDDRHTIARSLD